MMQKAIIPILVFVLLGFNSQAQLNRYIVQFKDKATNQFSLQQPWQYLSARALDRRDRFQINIDSTDLPITQRYIDSVLAAGNVTFLNSSKWLNQIAIFTTDAAAIAKINSFPFVNQNTAVAPRYTDQRAAREKFETAETPIPTNFATPASGTESLTAAFNYGWSNGQVKIHKGDFLHNLGFQGQGMQMAILDGGFTNYLTLPTFDSIRTNHQILGTWDFVLNASNVNGFNSHGTHCFSTIAAHMPGTFVGTAPKTSFYLFRTEDVPTEYPIEEQNLAAALERADSAGVDMASMSVGYSVFQEPSFNYTYADMDGNTTISARASDYAAAKGMLIVAANGNEGNNSWKYLISPADADSVLAVGAVDTLGNVASLSSYGPSYDGQIKPGVAGVGLNAVIADASTGQPAYNSGTSFACPNIAGLSACLWQAFPESNNMGIISALQESGTRATNPNDRIGYGIPDMKKAFVLLIKRFYQQSIQQAGCNTLIKFGVKSSAVMSFDIQRKLSAEPDFTTIHTMNGTGSFSLDTFQYADNLSAVLVPENISYRIKMKIDTDTSFYFNTVNISHVNACATYTFNGNGNYNDPGNWEGGLMPPSTLPAGSSIVINPSGTGECVLNIAQQIGAGALFTVLPGKRLLIMGDLNILQ
jgi:serine protease AprX